jgi:FtsH-binding integral membrane protein
MNDEPILPPSGPPAPPPGPIPLNPRKDALQFDKAENPHAPVYGLACAGCRTPLVDVYFLLAGQKFCAGCRSAQQRALAEGSKVGRFFRAAVFGAGAAIGGSILHYVWVKLTGIELGYIAILIGLGVGVAVKYGCDARGGWLYQGLAMFLTYAAIVGMFIPAIGEAIGKSARTPAAQEQKAAADPESEAPAVVNHEETKAKPGCLMGMVGLLVLTLITFVIAFAAPFLAVSESPIFLLIIGFALYEAWKINKRPNLAYQGPFKLGSSAPERAAGG